MADRLEDPDKLVSPQELEQLRRKLSATITGMFLSRDLGGNPFIYALTAAKPHILADKLPGGSEGWETAATDGKTFYWHPKFLRKLNEKKPGKDTVSELRQVMEHEAYHNIFWHCSPERAAGKNRDVWNLAVDYVVNTVIWMDHKPPDTSSHYGGNSTPKPQVSDMFKGTLGTPIPLQMLIDITTGVIPKEQRPPYPWCFVDEAVDRKSADWIYEQIMKSVPNWLPEFVRHGQGCRCQQPTGTPAPGQGDSQCDGGAPGPLDGHIPSKLTKEQAEYELASAHEKAKMMGRGDVPAAVDDLLKELAAPTLSPSDIIRSLCLQRIQDEGANKDYRRYRRRGLGGKPTTWVPHNYEFKPKWLCGLDTSGSMGTDDMASGIKELKLVGPESDGLVVPMDAVPYWGHATEIKNIDDLQTIKIKGRGGTVFRQFFEEMEMNVGYEWDVIIIITDGYIDQIPAALAPPADVLWLITADNVNFAPPFGRIIRLKR
jgi:predicted metal-dependent peptidase